MYFQLYDLFCTTILINASSNIHPQSKNPTYTLKVNTYNPTYTLKVSNLHTPAKVNTLNTPSKVNTLNTPS